VLKAKTQRRKAPEEKLDLLVQLGLKEKSQQNLDQLVLLVPRAIRVPRVLKEILDLKAIKVKTDLLDHLVHPGLLVVLLDRRALLVRMALMAKMVKMVKTALMELRAHQVDLPGLAVLLAQLAVLLVLLEQVLLVLLDKKGQLDQQVLGVSKERNQQNVAHVVRRVLLDQPVLRARSQGVAAQEAGKDQQDQQDLRVPRARNQRREGHAAGRVLLDQPDIRARGQREEAKGDLLDQQDVVVRATKA
jgi:hypothetical protein